MADQKNQPNAETLNAGPDPSKAFGSSYWILNSIEMFERLAYFGIRAVVPLYIMQATEPGGLHLTAVHKGWIYMWWAILQSWLPMFTGGIADRYGYKRVLAGAIAANAVGYLMMAFFHSYYGFFAGILVLATGTAFFKPALQGSIAQNLTKENSSMGWGIFYWVVNVGAVLAPVLATVILGKPHSAEGWRNLFIASSAYTCVNLLLLLTFRDVPSGADKTESLVRVFGRTVENIWPFWFTGGHLHPVRGPLGILMTAVGLVTFILYSWIAEAMGNPNLATPLAAAGGGLFIAGALLATWLEGGTFQWQLRLPIFLAIMSCFWMMMYQLWDLHPNFITDWIDSSELAAWLQANMGTWWEYGDRGLLQVPQQILLNLNAALIVLLVVPVSWAARKMRTLSAMLVGMSVATIGILVAGLTTSGWILLLGIVFFSLGEMWTGPKKNEYLGLIAPPGKKGLYLGYVNIPIGVGVGLGSWIAGIVYDNYGEKATLALKELGARPALVAEAAASIDWSDSLGMLPALMNIDRENAFELARQDLGTTDVPLSRDEAARLLRSFFERDLGQTQNLAYLLLAAQADYSNQIKAGVVEELRALAERTRASLPGDAPSTEVPDSLVALADAIEAGRQEVETAVIARYISKMPVWTGKKPIEVLAVAREIINADRPDDDKLGFDEVRQQLWNIYGDDAEVLNNLALEYLAQATDQLKKNITDMQFENPVEELPKKVGIGRTKAFAALSVAEGADEGAFKSAMAEIAVPSDQWTDRVYAYLAERDHVRFIAVAKRNWTDDVSLLETMVSSDADAKAIAEARIDEQSTFGAFFGWVAGLFGAEETVGLYARLAERPDLVQDVLAAKDWTRAPEQAAALLQLNPFEARALARAEVGDAPMRVTALLWNQYYPQYMVWLPFAAIGVVATIALGIFGQKAKKWKDMNA